MAGLYTQLRDVVASGPLLMPDEIMDEGTLSVIDFMDPYTWPDYEIVTPVSTTKEYKQFDARAFEQEGPPVKFNHPLTVAGGAIAFDGDKGENLVLPPAWKLDTGLKHFGMAFWVQMGPTIREGFNNRIAGFNAPGNVNQWYVAPTGDNTNKVAQLEFYCRPGDTTYGLASISGLSVANDIFNSSILLMGYEYEENQAGTHFDQRFYLGRGLRGARTAVPKVREFLPATTAGNALIGCPADFTGGTFQGNFRRAWLQDFAKSKRTMEEMIAQDWDVNRARMGAV
ncbi:hypothetical protein BJF92_12250 [Rhizobium rhizosphaerae]|uniref:Uncharacterized protein n=1 Tax=Xaviernesmea rhizosphaerae TaxID=1672749 RepID=A0A1Q9ANC3_9HYPH|nr:hypothetical protein [Xaviernesmea rhizosphaerae]OLP56836.1 hypothetical protein BJF92_12250 [Xaviernesmea rhizosphaerae]